MVINGIAFENKATGNEKRKNLLADYYRREKEQQAEPKIIIIRTGK